MSVVRMLIVTALSVLALGALAAPASAGIWTEVTEQHDRGHHGDRVPGRRPVLVHDRRRQDLQASRTAAFEQERLTPATSVQRHRVPGRRRRRLRGRRRTAPCWLQPGQRRHLGRRSPGITGCGATAASTSARPNDPIGDVDSVRFAGERARVAVGAGSRALAHVASRRTRPTSAARQPAGSTANDARRGRRCKVPHDIDDAFFVAGSDVVYFIAAELRQRLVQRRRPRRRRATEKPAGAAQRRSSTGAPRGRRPRQPEPPVDGHARQPTATRTARARPTAGAPRQLVSIGKSVDPRPDTTARPTSTSPAARCSRPASAG